jgi:hypothetical protein
VRNLSEGLERLIKNGIDAILAAELFADLLQKGAAGVFVH